MLNKLILINPFVLSDARVCQTLKHRQILISFSIKQYHFEFTTSFSLKMWPLCHITLIPMFQFLKSYRRQDFFFTLASCFSPSLATCFFFIFFIYFALRELIFDMRFTVLKFV